MSFGFLIKFLVFSLAVNSALATSVDGSVGCPDAFVGVVEKIEEPQAPFNSLAKQKVRFVVQEMIKGNLTSPVTIKALKYGPNQFISGDQYRVELRFGRICSIVKL